MTENPISKHQKVVASNYAAEMSFLFSDSLHVGIYPTVHQVTLGRLMGSADAA